MRKLLSSTLTLLLASLLLTACTGRGGDAAPTASPTPVETSDIVVVTAAPASQATGYYTLSEGEDTVTVYLLKAQGAWQAEAEPTDAFKLTKTADTADGYTTFLIEAVETGNEGKVNFSCAADGQTPLGCSLTLFTNEAYCLEVTAADLPQRQTQQQGVEQPYAYGIDYHRSSALLTSIVGDQTVKDALTVIDAFLAGETSAAVTPDGNEYLYANKLGYALNILCPPFAALTDFNTLTAYSDGLLHWNFLASQEETQASLAAFETQVNSLMSNIDARDTQTAKAVLLYHGLTTDAVYDYAYYDKKEVTEEESRLPNSGFTAIKEHSGVCNAYSAALCFLYTQVGIESVTVNGSAPDAFHQWTLARVDGKLYYLDPTFDLGGGLLYFGLTTEERCTWAGGFDKDSINAFGTSIEGSYTLDDTRFTALHAALTAGYVELQVDHTLQSADLGHGLYTLDLGD